MSPHDAEQVRMNESYLAKDPDCRACDRDGYVHAHSAGMIAGKGWSADSMTRCECVVDEG